MTTLAKIGYGDTFPVSNIEKLSCLVILSISIVFFSYSLDRFMVLIKIDPSKEAITKGHIQPQRFAMNNWLDSLTRFRENKPLPKEMIQQLQKDLNSQLMHDRKAVISEGRAYLRFLPAHFKRAVVVGYIYDDVISNFRRFFKPELYFNCNLLENLSYALKYRFIQGSPKVSPDQRLMQGILERSFIYREGDEIQEMFFISKGVVAVGYTYFQSKELTHSRTHMCLSLGREDFIGDYYILFDLKSEYCVEATTDVQAFALDKTKLLLALHQTQSSNEVSVLSQFRERSFLRYSRLSDAIRWHKEQSLWQMNNEQQYYQLSRRYFQQDAQYAKLKEEGHSTVGLNDNQRFHA